jgi:hypothetical protein
VPDESFLLCSVLVLREHVLTLLKLAECNLSLLSVMVVFFAGSK